MHRLILISLFFSFVMIACNNNSGTAPAVASNEDASADSTWQALRDSINRHKDTSGLSFRYQLAEYLYDKGKYEEAMTELDSMLIPDSLKSFPHLYPEYLNARALILERTGDTASAINYYEEIAANPGASVSEDFLFHLANLYAEQKNAKAVIICNNLEKNPNLQNKAMPPFIRGIYYSGTRNYADALKQFDLAILNDYTFIESYIEKGLAYYDQRKFRQAQEIFEKALEVNTAYADAYFWVARCEEKLNHPAEALNNYKRALALDTSIAEARQAIKELSQ